MKTVLSIYSWLAAAAVAIGLFTTGAHAGNAAGAPVLFAQSAPDCYAIGQRIAAQNGGTLAKASAEQGGAVCKIVVLVPGQDGERPRRKEFTVPAR